MATHSQLTAVIYSFCEYTMLILVSTSNKMKYNTTTTANTTNNNIIS